MHQPDHPATARRPHRAPATRLVTRGLVKGVLAVAVLGVWASTSAWALYKEVGPDGRVTYTDRPADPRAKPLRARQLATGTGVDVGKLPFELRQAAETYPVVLYTAKDCAPCTAGRDWLKARGIPFQEWSVNTREDIDAFKLKEASDQLPVLRVGGQRLKGFMSQDWASYLELAGYPASSKLPADYIWPEPQPLAPRAPAKPAANAPSETPAGATPSMPAEGTPPGFRF